jgi:tetratricopeptide (TPR) repeat protein
MHTGKLFLSLLAASILIVSCKQTNLQILDHVSSLEQNKEYKKAIDKCNLVLARDSSNELAYYYRGRCLAGLKEFQKAIKDFSKILSLKPAGTYLEIDKNSVIASDEDKMKVPAVDALFQRGIAEYELDSLNKALRDFQSCINMGSEGKSRCLLWIGGVYTKAGKKDTAGMYYEKARVYGDPEAQNLIDTNCK